MSRWTRFRLRPLALFPLLVVGALLANPTALLAQNSTAPPSDPKALDLADATLKAMGGQEGWKAARFFRFDFSVEKGGKVLANYQHWWDRQTGRYRLEGKNKEGKPFVVLFNVQDRKGKVWLDGKPADAEASAKLLEYAYGRFINDTYWILMPFKLRDPGAHLRAEEPRTDASGKKWSVAQLSFDEGIGLTPADHYWAFIDPETHLMGRWEYVLEGEKPPPTAWTWEEWKRFGPILLSSVKKEVGADTVIRFPNLSVSETVDESAFKEPV
ncbi:MAG TPA: hypothetical protein VKL61_00675 [Candidatus Polarisedimenticolia bacterium]|nr:hypothetical protein [Candidatus Polarisedimenticolia bacterium]